MKRPPLCACVAAMLWASACAAAPNAGGVNLRWTDCTGDGGVTTRVFACDTNVGSDRMVCSFVSDLPIHNVSGAELTLDIRSLNSTLPLWWQFRNSGTCRVNSLGMNLSVDPAWANCVDAWSGQGAGGISVYSIGLLAPNMSRIRSVAAVPQASVFEVSPVIEYFVSNFVVNHQRTTGTGSCSGCSTPACILFAELRVTTTVSANNRVFNLPKDGNNSQWIGWQGGNAQTPSLVCDANGCNYDYTCVLSVVPTRASTWSAVKTLYH